MSFLEPLFLWCVIAFGARRHIVNFWSAGGWKQAIVITVGIASGAVALYASQARTPYYVNAFESETGYAFPVEGHFADRFASEPWGCTIAIVDVEIADAKRLRANLQSEPDFRADTSTPDCGGVDTSERGPYLATGYVTSEDSWFWWGISQDDRTLAFMRMEL